MTGIEHKVTDGGRGPWTEAALDKLLRTRWEQPGGRVAEETHAWIVGIGGYTGARLEEIARLRVRDVQNVDGVWCLIIRAHVVEMEGGRKEREWMPKTAAGKRAVPVHRSLIAAGLLDLVEKRREAGRMP